MIYETVAILTPGAPTEDAYGQSIPGATTETTVEALVAPGESEERLSRQATVVADFTVYTPVGTAVDEDAQVRVRGDVYEVDGQPEEWAGAGVVIRVTASRQT